MNPNRRLFLQLGALAGAGAAIRWQLDPTGGLLFEATRAFASTQVSQTPLLGSGVPRFVEPLTTFAGRRVSGRSLRVEMREFQQRILPRSIYDSLPDPYERGSYVWGYAVANDDERDNGDSSAHASRASRTDANLADEDRASSDRADEDSGGAAFPGATIEARKGHSTTVKYENNLPTNPVLRKYLTIDQTLHWADPLRQGHLFTPYSGPIPTVVHLHGGEDQSTSDGAPEAWFTNNGLHGPGYFSLSPTDPNAAIYHYPNKQESTTLWMHDHALGLTRINVFAGLAAFYLIRDEFDTGQVNNPLGLPAGRQEIELMIQDHQFDTNGQMLFPDSAVNPSLVHGAPSNPKIHPFWIPSFFGDTILVNGRTWPFLNVQPRRYRFRILNASNARFYRMGLADASGAVGPPMYQIGTDGGLLDVPVKLAGLIEERNPGGPIPTTRLFLAPSERGDIIVDFAGQEGKTFTLTNDTQVPFPSGPDLDAADPTRQIMQFRVVSPLSRRDTTYDPASGQPLRGGPNQEPVIVRMVNPISATLAPGVNPSVKRQLVLTEFEAPSGNGGNTRGTPVVDMVNNIRWNGLRDGGGNAPIPGSVQDKHHQDIWMTELPRVGSTEVWEILNLTVDAHPIHLHLVQFQILSRQLVLTTGRPGGGPPGYLAVWTKAFKGGDYNGERADGTWGPVTYPAGQVIPGYGPPNDYFTPNADGALGGNPAFSPYLFGRNWPPNPNEAGWKDVAKVMPGFLTRMVVRWAPQATAIDGVVPGQNLYSFDPTRGPGYLVHCHILDHEDNEMMRPYLPVP